MEPTFTYTHYLAAKKTVDDRALNRTVWDAWVRALPPQSPDAPVRILEIGAGVGTMLERLVAQNVLQHAVYTAIDQNPDNIAMLSARMPAWSKDYALEATALAKEEVGIRRTQLANAERTIRVEAEAIDLYDLGARRPGAQTWDALIAHAVLDLLDIPRALPLLLALVRPGGLVYLTINFDGATIFEPEIAPDLDRLVEQLYHQTMDERVTNGRLSGDSRTGRHLFHRLKQNSVEILQAGSSDWVVFAGREGYAGDEAYFLRFIVHTVERALENHPGLQAQQAQFRDWIAQRRRQIETGDLVYIAHQIDFVGRRA
ncbi:MAG: methyltransferase domain-containing protein [Anaerolineae bacterium]